MLVLRCVHLLFIHSVLHNLIPFYKVVVSVVVILSPKHDVVLAFYLELHLQVFDFGSHEVDEIVFLFQRLLQLADLISQLYFGIALQ